MAFVSGEPPARPPSMRTSGLGPRRHWRYYTPPYPAEKPGRDNDVEAGLARALAFHRE